MKKTQMEAILSNVPGEFKELFIENSKITVFNVINGKLKTPTVKTLKGASLLVREGNEEYFSVISGKNEGLEGEISKFIESNFFKVPASKVTLKGEEEYNISNLDLIKGPEKLAMKIIEVFEEELKDISFVRSSSIALNLSEKAFIVGNSDGNFASDNLFYNTFFINLIGERDGNTEEIFKKITGIDILDSFNKEKFRETLKVAIETLDNQLGAEPSPSGEMEVIIGNESGGTIIHEAVGHGLEADLQSTSAYAGKIGEKVASDCVTVVDDPNISKMRGYYGVDHEGNTPKKTVLIENGVLKSYMHTSKTAKKFGVESTGHARRENYNYTTLVRMGTTYLAPGTDTREELISRVKTGIFVSEMGGGQVDTTTGDFVFKVQSGYKIENGKLTSRIRGATLSGNGPEMLKNIYGVCNDLDFFDGGTCGKGQSMPVSDGTATVLTKLKVSGLQ